MDTNEIINSFIDAMKSAGCEPALRSDIVPSGEDTYYRLKDDRKDKRGAYYFTIEPDGFAYGNFYNFRTGEKGSWHSKKGDKSLSDSERDELQARFKEAQERKEQEKIARQELVASKAREEYKTFTPAQENHPYLIKKGVKPFNLKQKGNILIAPCIMDGKLWGYQTINADGDKYFLEGAKKDGCYCPLIRAGENTSTIFIVEGVATGLSVREALELPVVIAFDAGNLHSVANSLKRKYPDVKRFVFCADNDHETKIKGKLVNTGITKAQQAAVKAGNSRVIFPEFDESEASGNTDFNDLHRLKGLQAVKDRILSALIERSVPTPVDSDTPPILDVPPIEPEERMMITQGEPSGDFGMPFRVLGYCGGEYFYYSFRRKEIVKMTAAGHTQLSLLQLADLDLWESQFPKASSSKIALYAANKLMALAEKRGVFDEEGKIRGVGVWKDATRVIVNCGNKIFIDNQEYDYHEVKSTYTYVSGKPLPPTNFDYRGTDFSVLQTIFSLPNWDNKASGKLVAGWIAVAPLCSALSFRPHIFLTGQAGSGKSTICGVISKCLDGIAYCTDGSSSEASIRSRMGYNSRPIIFDEAEGKGSAVTSMDAVLALARASTSGGKITKYGQKEFNAMSPFCFSAINPPIKTLADETRISRMILRKSNKLSVRNNFKEFNKLVSKHIDDEFSCKLFSYMVNNFKIVEANCKLLMEILSDTLVDPRASQLIGHMLAGYSVLSNNKELTKEEAIKLVKEHDWCDFTAVNEESDPDRLLHHIKMSIIRVPTATNTRNMTINDLIRCAAGVDNTILPNEAINTLKMYSIKVIDKRVHIGNRNQNLANLLNNTDWGLKWNRTLSDLDDAINEESTRFSPADRQRCVSLPISYFDIGE